VIRGRLRRRGGKEESGQETVFEIDPGELSGVFSAPRWLRDLGLMAWLLVGVAALLVGSVWLLSLVHTIAIPLIVASIIAAVISPAVNWFTSGPVPRGVAAALVLILFAAMGAALLVVILAGVAHESSHISDQLSRAADKISGWLTDLGVDRNAAEGAKQDASASIGTAAHTLLNGVAQAIETLSSLAVFLSFTTLGLFFMLKDGPMLRARVDRHLGLPEDVARTIT
jgi:putative heme transporter